MDQTQEEIVAPDGEVLPDIKTVFVHSRMMAKVLGVPWKWLDEEARFGRVPALQVDGNWLFHPQAVIQVLAQRSANEMKDRVISIGRPKLAIPGMSN